jgi:hypothetical protein
MSSAFTAGAGRVARARLKRFAWTHPEWWVVALCWSAWAALVFERGRHQGHGSLDEAGFAWEVGGWMLMVAATMLPLVVPTVRQVAGRSLWSRRHRATLVFVGGFCAAWLVLGLAVAALREGAWAHTSAAAALAFAGAALWQRTRLHRRGLIECHRSEPLAPRGWRADRDCLRFGAIMGGYCVLSCWPLMLACALASHSLVALAGTMVVGVSERWYYRPRTRTMLAVTVALAVYHAALAMSPPLGALAAQHAPAAAPEIVASTGAPFFIGAAATRVELAVRSPRDPELAGAAPRRRVFLNVEKMISSEWSGPWSVYLNLPTGEAPATHPELAAGELPMYGLVESSRTDGKQEAPGLYDQLEITELYARLGTRPGYRADRLVVTFVPVYPTNVRISVARLTVSMTRR